MLECGLTYNLDEVSRAMDPDHPGWLADAMADVDYATSHISRRSITVCAWYGPDMYQVSEDSSSVSVWIEMDETKPQLVHLLLHVYEETITDRESISDARRVLYNTLRRQLTDTGVREFACQDRHHSEWYVLASMSADLRLGEEIGTVVGQWCCHQVHQ